jgi:septum site-determining protein MinC
MPAQAGQCELTKKKMATDSIAIKGVREGLIVTLPATPDLWSDVLAQLEAKLSASPAFFKGARVGLIVGARELTEDNIRAARDLLLRHDVTLWALIGDEAATRGAAAHLGLDTRLPPREPRAERAQPAPALEPVQPAAAPPEPPTEVSDAAMVVRRTLRSGASLRHPGSIVVIGDVHSGAEVIAGGDVVVWGRLHGTVHAGAFGDDEAIVCALDLSPTQLRIGRYITRSPDERQRKLQPEMARVRHGRIEAVAWNLKSTER